MPFSRLLRDSSQTSSATFTKAYRYTYLALGILIFGLELARISITGAPNLPDIAIAAFFAALIGAASWWPPYLEILYILTLLITEMTGLLANLSSPHFGAFAIIISWISSSRFVLAAAATLVETGLTIAYSHGTIAAVTSALATITFTLLPGLTLRWYQRRYADKTSEANTLKKQVATIEADTRQALAGELHDTLAKDLAHLAITAQNLADNPDAAGSEQLQQLADSATSASRRIRPVILNLDSARMSSSLDEAISSAQTLLSTRAISLQISTPAQQLDVLLPRDTQFLASLVVREGATNILKYAPENSEAELEVTIENDILTLSLSNTIAATPRQSNGLTGGYGIANLTDRVQREGGTLNFATFGNLWLLNAIIPFTKDLVT